MIAKHLMSIHRFMDRVRQRTKRKTPLTAKELIEELKLEAFERPWRTDHLTGQSVLLVDGSANSLRTHDGMEFLAVSTAK